MHYTGQIYRPPSEAYSVLLQVTSGCSHNKCNFCNGAKGVPYYEEPLEHVIEDLYEVREYRPDADRVHLLSHEAFVLSYEKLMTIAERIHEILPNVETISAMASINNIKDKSVEQLKNLYDAGYRYLYIGNESGLDEVLKYCRKGSTVSDSVEQMKKLDEAGIRYTAMYLLGLAGSGNGEKNAIATAEMFNQVKPSLIGINSLTIFPDTDIYKDVKSGKFVEATELERTEELKTFLEHLTAETYVAATHVTVGTPVKGRYPRDREKMLAEVQRILDNFDEAHYRLRREMLRSV